MTFREFRSMRSKSLEKKTTHKGPGPEEMKSISEDPKPTDSAGSAAKASLSFPKSWFNALGSKIPPKHSTEARIDVSTTAVTSRTESMAKSPAKGEAGEGQEPSASEAPELQDHSDAGEASALDSPELTNAAEAFKSMEATEVDETGSLPAGARDGRDLVGEAEEVEEVGRPPAGAKTPRLGTEAAMSSIEHRLATRKVESSSARTERTRTSESELLDKTTERETRPSALNGVVPDKTSKGKSTPAESLVDNETDEVLKTRKNTKSLGTAKTREGLNLSGPNAETTTSKGSAVREHRDRPYSLAEWTRLFEDARERLTKEQRGAIRDFAKERVEVFDGIQDERSDPADVVVLAEPLGGSADRRKAAREIWTHAANVIAKQVTDANARREFQHALEHWRPEQSMVYRPPGAGSRRRRGLIERFVDTVKDLVKDVLVELGKAVLKEFLLPGVHFVLPPTDLVSALFAAIEMWDIAESG